MSDADPDSNTGQAFKSIRDAFNKPKSAKPQAPARNPSASTLEDGHEKSEWPEDSSDTHVYDRHDPAFNSAMERSVRNAQDTPETSPVSGSPAPKKESYSATE